MSPSALPLYAVVGRSQSFRPPLVCGENLSFGDVTKDRRVFLAMDCHMWFLIHIQFLSSPPGPVTTLHQVPSLGELCVNQLLGGVSVQQYSACTTCT